MTWVLHDQANHPPKRVYGCSKEIGAHSVKMYRLALDSRPCDCGDSGIGLILRMRSGAGGLLMAVWSERRAPVQRNEVADAYSNAKRPLGRHLEDG